jgi:pimeloyl-ACP methyl ester carboxylesterase
MIRHAVLAGVGLTLALSAPPAAFGADEAPPYDAYGTPHLVSLPGGRRINLICMGEGSPTVILESGLGSHVYVWSLVQYKIARVTRTCAYERAGMGVSDEGPAPRDAKAVNADLQALLRAAGIKGPYVLVGHSLGGYFVRLFADLHPRQVAGMVLVDPSIDGQIQLIQTVAARSPTPAQNSPPNPCAVAAQAGQLKPGTDIYKTCVGDPPSFLGPVLGAAIIAQETRAATYLTMASEVAAMDQDSAETVANRKSYGNMPLIVLTAGQQPKDPGLTDAQNQAWAKLWMQGHDAIAALSSRGRNRVVPGSGHFIQIQQPQAVIDAVSEVVAEVRQNAGD